MCGVSVWEPGCQGASDGVRSDGEKVTQLLTMLKLVKSESFSVAVSGRAELPVSCHLSTSVSVKVARFYCICSKAIIIKAMFYFIAAYMCGPYKQYYHPILILSSHVWEFWSCQV